MPKKRRENISVTKNEKYKQEEEEMEDDVDPATEPNLTLNPYVERELLATIDGLGESIEADSTSVYTKGEECLGMILHIILSSIQAQVIEFVFSRMSVRFVKMLETRR